MISLLSDVCKGVNTKNNGLIVVLNKTSFQILIYAPCLLHGHFCSPPAKHQNEIPNSMSTSAMFIIYFVLFSNKRHFLIQLDPGFKR
jgi:hypothetical protein